jgi:hypothetical protein
LRTQEQRRADPASQILGKAAILIVFAFLVFRRGIAYMGIPPLYGAEITILLFTLLWLRGDTMRKFLENTYGRLAFALAILPLFYLPFIDLEGAVDFFRNASVLYYTVFWFFGYAIVCDREMQDWFIGGLYYAMLASTAHVILSDAFPLDEVSPLVNEIFFLGHHDSCYIYYSLGLGYAVIFCQRLGWLKTSVLIAASLLGHVLHFERASLLGILAVMFVLWWFYPIWFTGGKKIAYALIALAAVCVGLFVIMDETDSELLKNASQQTELLVATFGTSDALPDREGTKDHRLRMWTEIIENTIEKNVLVGQGFSHLLLMESFRNPHNSFITIFGRAGLIGLAIALPLYFGFSLKLAIQLAAKPERSFQPRLLLYLCFAPAFFSGSLFAPTLEAPYSALVMNFIFGAALRYSELASMSNRQVASLNKEHASP